MFCHFNTSVQDYENIYTTVMHSMTCVEVPLHSYGAYLILFRTPKTMQSVKHSLLMIHFCTSLLDFTLSFLGIPVLFIPAGMGYPLGLFLQFGVSSVMQTYLFVVVFCSVGTSYVTTFENRYYHVVQYNDFGILDSKKRTSLAFLNIVFAITFFIPTLLARPEHELGKIYWKNLFPCISDEIFEKSELFIQNLDWKIPRASICICIVFYITQMATYSFSTMFHLFATNFVVSKATLIIQRKFFIAICCQIAVPFFLIGIPLLYWFCAILFDYFDHTLNLVTMLIIATHGIAATILLILVHEPYRHFTSEFVHCSFSKSPNVYLPNLGVSRISI